MADRNIYLKIEEIEDYSPVAPMDKTAPPIRYKRDCRRGMGHANSEIPESEVVARTVTALVYREYKDPDYLVPVIRKIADADVNEPIFSRRVPGAVLWAHPGDVLRITVLNGHTQPHSFHIHGLDYGIDSDGAWPFGTQTSDGRRSDEICPGQTWTYVLHVEDDSLGCWPFHDHWKNIASFVDRGLFGGLVVTPKRTKPPLVYEIPDHLIDLLGKVHKPRPPLPPFPGPGPRPDPPRFIPGAIRPLPGLGERVRPPLDVVRREPPRPQMIPDPPHAANLDELRVRDLLDEWALHDLVREFALPKPEPKRRTHQVPIFYHVMRDDEAMPAFDSGDIEELTGVFELEFDVEGSFDYFCRFHPFMEGTVDVVPGGPDTVTVQIVDAPVMSFVPATTTVGVNGTVRWENLSVQHHTVTSKEGASMATHCFNGRGFIGNSPTIEANAGDKLKWYLFNLDIGHEWHNFHTHAMRWTFAGQNVDVRSFGPAGSFTAETVVPHVLVLEGAMAEIQDPDKRPDDAKKYELAGDYVFHCHVHHHVMNGMIGLVRAKQTVWLTDEMVAELEATRGFPQSIGNDCPDVDPAGCLGSGGRWEVVPGDPEVTFMHSMLIPDSDRVLFWGYTRADQSRLFNAATGTYGAPANQPADLLPGEPLGESDLWSAEHEYIDGANPLLLAHGGFTPEKSFTFDPSSDTWTRVEDTAENRFYSTTIALEDGRLLTLHGSFSKSIEVYTHGTGWSAPLALPGGLASTYQYYPWTYLLPDGRLFIAGPENPTRRFDPTGPVDDPAEAFPMVVGMDRSTSGQNGTSVILPLRPPGYAPRVVIAGGNNGGLMKSAEIIDLSAPSPSWNALPDMQEARGNLTGVLLPTGQVFLAGGISGTGGPAEILDAEYGPPSWTVGPPMTYQRGYHSSMILLRDGSVLCGGDPGGIGGPTEHERYYPWYYDLVRPAIDNAPTTINYGSAFSIDTPDASGVAEVILMRPGAVTHGFNMAQRAVECEITGGTAASVDATSPPNGRVAPPGWYLLFILNGPRVPSEGRWIRLTT